MVPRFIQVAFLMGGGFLPLSFRKEWIWVCSLAIWYLPIVPKDMNSSTIREIFHLLKVPGMISFAGGNPASSALEPDVVSEIVSEVLKRDGTAILQYGATEGYAPLRESIAEFVKGCGLNTSADAVLP